MSPFRLGVRGVLSISLLAGAVLAGLATTVPGGSAVASGPALTPVAATTPRVLGAPWGVYQGRLDYANQPYLSATGTTRSLLGKIALRPRATWFGHWIPTSRVPEVLGDYISESQHGNPDALVQMSIFRLWPRTEAARWVPMTAAEQADYRAWIDAAAATIGDARVAMVLEPDLGAALKSWSPATRLALARYAAVKFSRLPRTTVYLDAGDSDWLKPAKAAAMLRSAGVQYVRGFALGATHYSPMTSNIAYGRKVSSYLGRLGIWGKHMVLDTSDNGRGFTYKWYYRTHPHGRMDNAEVCRSRSQARCITLGVPPTSHVGNADIVDAYLWIGRAWLTRQQAPFDMARALGMARTTPY